MDSSGQGTSDGANDGRVANEMDLIEVNGLNRYRGRQLLWYIGTHLRNEICCSRSASLEASNHYIIAHGYVAYAASIDRGG